MSSASFYAGLPILTDFRDVADSLDYRTLADKSHFLYIGVVALLIDVSEHQEPGDDRRARRRVELVRGA